MGQECESRVCAYLEGLGMRVLKRNFRVPCGELDVVALSADGLLCVVEVKSMSRKWDDGEIEAMVGPAKRHRIKSAALLLIDGGIDVKYKGVRFDVACVGRDEIKYYEGAF